MAMLVASDTLRDAVVKMSRGNPGAMQAMLEAGNHAKRVDPSGLGWLGPILMLDALEIYGTDIYVLWADICNRNTSKFIGIIRAVQLGLLSDSTLKDAASRQDYSGRKLIPLDQVLEKVKEKLSDFTIDED